MFVKGVGIFFQKKTKALKIVLLIEVSLSAPLEPLTATFFFDNKKEGKKLLLSGEPWIFAVTQKSSVLIHSRQHISLN